MVKTILLKFDDETKTKFDDLKRELRQVMHLRKLSWENFFIQTLLEDSNAS